MKLKPFLNHITEALEKDDFETMDQLLAKFYSHDFGEQHMAEVEEILTEVTLYSEFKEAEYKQKALELLQK